MFCCLYFQYTPEFCKFVFYKKSLPEFLFRKTFDLFCFFAFFVFFELSQCFFALRVQDDDVEDCHKADSHIAKVPYKSIGRKTADEQHNKCKNFVCSLGCPVISKKIGHIASRIKQDSKEGGKTKQEQCRCNEDHAESSEMMFHCRLQKIHSGKSCDFFFRCEEHDHCSTAADHDRIYKNTKCLYKSCLNRLITFCRCCRTRCRAGTCLVGKQTSLDSIHQYCAETAGCRLYVSHTVTML